ncbi:hypothetical protein GOP47_0005865 [Adiantum capillus-veneris]|uniref:Uncharacterized protein n=1 Tax=Adiantum capillus-veneris TaxID=13818 RepID=A0A9D4V5V2_ADICA|nr:hypothetical protein GOP47_0005865 [Adiantum capillus-veneris]
MTGSERYLELQAKRAREEYEEALPRSPRMRLPPPGLQEEVERLSLQDAPSAFRDRLRHILQGVEGKDEGSQPMTRMVVDSVDVAELDAAQRLQHSIGGQAATIIGTSQQGKSTLLNSLLHLFGFLHPPNLVFPETDLVPTNTKDNVGLPFPLRLVYGPEYEVIMQHWDAQRLQDVMCSVATQSADILEEIYDGFRSVEDGSFLQLIARHWTPNESDTLFPAAVESLQADGGVEVHRFLQPNPSLEVHKAVCEFFVEMVESAQWLRYERVTLRCPSQLLKQLSTGLQSDLEMCILDLPGVGIADDNNLLVEELVCRDTVEAGTVIVLTGERSFTEDVIRVLRTSVFERLLDPLVVPRPTVAITNSRKLRGLKEEDMEDWRTATLHGSLGWNTELQSFAKDVFSGSRRHRELESLQPDLFPNDLEGFMEAKEGAREKGVSMLVGYFLRLPQEALLASVVDVLECTRSIMRMVDQLWQADMVSWKGVRPSSRLMKEVKGLREEEFKRDLDAELSLSMQRKIFGFESEFCPSGTVSAIHSHKRYIQDLFIDEKRKLADRYDMFKAKKADLRHEIPKAVKDALIHIALQWDENIGFHAYKSFLRHAEEISKRLYRKWANQLFFGTGRKGLEDQKQDQACQFMLAYLESTAAAAFKEDVFKYTFTHGLRLQAWNLDLGNVIKVLGPRRGRSATVPYDQVWSSLKEVVESKEAYFKEHILEHVTLQSLSIKQLNRLLKEVILKTFADCEKNFSAVMDALGRLAKGQLTMNEDPVIILREQLGGLVKVIERYVMHCKEMRNSFGAQELEKVIQTRKTAWR